MQDTVTADSPSFIDNLKKEWFPNVGTDLLSGAVVALVLIPEAIAFSIIAGVDPKVGLYAASIIAMVTGILGGRIGLISAATAALAVLFTGLIKNHGIQYLFAATILTGVLQITYGIFGLGRLIRFVPKPVMSGFLNALAVLIFLAQLPQFAGATPMMFALLALGLIIIYFLPRFTKAVPSSLVAIVIVTIIAIVFKIPLRTVGDAGQLPSALPSFGIPQVPLNLETLAIIFPVALGASIVGLLESLLTAQALDDLTHTSSDKNRECRAQGIANFITGFFGGMGGCAMVGQSMINFKNGGRGRLSSFSAGAFLFFFIFVMRDYVAQIPMVALVSVMFMVAASTFDWSSIKKVQTMPRAEIAIMAATITAVLWTHNLAIGVGIGILLSAMFFARKVAKLIAVHSSFEEATQTRTYTVWGQLFFVSSDEFVAGFDFSERPQRVIIDLTHTHIWDGSAVAALDKIVFRLRGNGAKVEVIGLNEASKTLIDKTALHDKEDGSDAIGAH